MNDLLDYALSRTVAPVLSAVTTAEAKKQANVVAEDDDDYVARLVAVATEQVERDSNRALLTQTWQLTRHAFPAGRKLVLPRAPLQSVSSITYLDTAESEQTLAEASYLVDTHREPGVIWLDEDADWPSLVSSRPNAVVITYVAGWTSASEVPQRAKHAILLLVAHWYRVREAVGQVGQEIALAYGSLIQGLRPAAYP